MNNDLISRAAVLKDLELLAKFQPEGKQSTILGVCATIRATHAVDAEPVRHGRWENTKASFHKKCSYCKSILHMPRKRNYCPNCGAKMDAEE